MLRHSPITLLVIALVVGLSSCASAPPAGEGPEEPYLIRVEGEPPGADLSAYDPAEAISKPPPKASFKHLGEQPRGFHGRLLLEIEVLRDGTVGSVLVPKGVDPVFNNALVKEVGKWKFRPTLSPGGEPVVSWVHITITLKKI